MANNTPTPPAPPVTEPNWPVTPPPAPRSAPPTAAPPNWPTAPPTWPTAPAAWPTAPPAAPPPAPPWPPAPPTPAGGPAPRTGGSPTDGTRRAATVAIAVLCVALLIGALGGFALVRTFGDDGTTFAPSATTPSTVPQRSVPTMPSSPQDDFGFPSTPSSPDTSQNAAPDGDAAAAAQAVLPGTVDITTVTPQGVGAGSGIVLSEDGRVLTNRHVVEGATEVMVTDLDSGERYEADVLGSSASPDVAVLQLRDASDLDVAPIGESASVDVGDTIVAIGNPDGDPGGDPTIVTGTVVGFERGITVQDPSGGGAERIEGLIETTAPLRPGYSGGPMVDLDGTVVGIDTAASAGPGGQAGGEGYAVPIEDALGVADQIAEGDPSDTVRIGPRPVLGVSVAPSDSLGGAGGVVVEEVAADSGAAEAGITAGAVITSVDGDSVATFDDVAAALTDRSAGDEVEVTWIDAGGAERSATIELGEGPAA